MSPRRWGARAAVALLGATLGATDGNAQEPPTAPVPADAAAIPTAAAPVPADAALVGTVLPSAPAVPPGRVAPLPRDPLRAAIERRQQGDVRAAIWYEEQMLALNLVSGRTRAAVQLALGIGRMDQGDHNLAATHFEAVKASTTPIASWGTWYLARADHARGRHTAAAQSCAAYRSRWPEGPFADECLVLMGDAYVAAGQRVAAIGAYQKYLQLHPDSPREETLRLGIALAISTTDPKSAIPMLQTLAVEHAYHSTGESALARLAELEARGYPAKLPDTVAWQCKQAIEMKRCGFDDAAWARYQALATKAQTDPTLQSWIDAQEERFAWGTKQYEALAASMAEAYRKAPSASLAWDRYRALSRGGMWGAAVDQLAAGQKDFPTSSQFRSIRETQARGLLLAGRYTEARDAWTTLGKSGGGREARWLAAYAAFRAGDLPDALSRLDAVIAGGGGEADAARYYKARTLAALGRSTEAEAIRAQILAEDPLSWYALLLRSQGISTAGASAPTAGALTPVAVPSPTETAARAPRNGRWPGPRATPPPAAAPVGTGGVSVAPPPTGRSLVASAVEWRRWTVAPANPTTTASAPPVASDSVVHERRPDSYAPGFLFDPLEGDRLLSKLGEQYGAVFPWALAAADLARAGIYHEAAPLVARMYDAIEAAEKGAPIPSTPVVKSGTSSDTLRAVNLTADDWRQIFYFVHDDYHAARFSWGTNRKATNEADRMTALRRAFPTAEVNALYRYGQQESVDPLMMLGLMRQESVYRQWALSPVGAIGLLQVMPRTGARVAALMGDHHYSPEYLEDPAVNVRYGVWYMGRLLDRFEGAYPLAVASYNGGPHNVSSWLRPWGATIRMDDYVEQIPYGETRDYVKKVSGYYATYVALYAEAGERIEVPVIATGDHPEVINF